MKWKAKAKSKNEANGGSDLWLECDIDAPTIDSAIKAIRELSPDGFIYSLVAPKPV